MRELDPARRKRAPTRLPAIASRRAGMRSLLSEKLPKLLQSSPLGIMQVMIEAAASGATLGELEQSSVPEGDQESVLNCGYSSRCSDIRDSAQGCRSVCSPHRRASENFYGEHGADSSA